MPQSCTERLNGSVRTYSMVDDVKLSVPIWRQHLYTWSSWMGHLYIPMVKTLGWVHQTRWRWRSAAVALSFRKLLHMNQNNHLRKRCFVYSCYRENLDIHSRNSASCWQRWICIYICCQSPILNYTGAEWTCCFGKERGSTETLSKLFANHNALGQLTNHITFLFS